MAIQTRHPHPALQPYIQGYQYASFEISDLSQPVDLHPIGHAVLAFMLNEEQVIREIKSGLDYTVRFSLTGQLSQHFSFHPLAPSISTVAVAFKPMGAYRLLGVSQYPMVNHSIAMDEILPESRCVKHQLEDHATDPQKVFSILEDWLLKLLVKNDRTYINQLDFACQLIHNNAGTLRIDELCRSSGMSKSGLEAHFNEKIGVSPKMYSRIIRFINVNRFIQQHAAMDWQHLVYRFDYFDQAHFIKEFKSFFGYSPSKAHLSSQNLAKAILEGTQS